MLVRDAMTAHAEWISPDISLTEVARKMRDAKSGAFRWEKMIALSE